MTRHLLPAPGVKISEDCQMPASASFAALEGHCSKGEALPRASHRYLGGDLHLIFRRTDRGWGIATAQAVGIFRKACEASQ